MAGAALGDELYSAAAGGRGRAAPFAVRAGTPPNDPLGRSAAPHAAVLRRDVYPDSAALATARDAVLDAAREGTVYIGRQAVLDAAGRVMGYELLYRRRGEDRAVVRDHLDATRTVVSAAMVEFGLEHIVRDGVAFVNVTRDFLASGLHRTLPAERVILEVLEDEAVDDHLVDLLTGVRAEGYRLALDDYTPGSAHRRLLGLVDTVKIDMLATPRAGLAALVDELRSRQVTVLAEKVETYADLDAARALGVDLVQGFFFHRPEVLAGRRVAIGQLPAARLLATIDEPEASVRELETIIACDPGLTHRLLRLASSPAGTARPVATLRAALVLLGRRTIKNLALVAMIHGVDGKTSEVATTALVRAKTCERLAARVAPVEAPAAFLVGLLSVLDAVFDAPLADLVGQLPLADEVAAAVVARDGRLGALLNAAIGYERADLTCAEVDLAAALDAYVHAVGWADITMRSLATAPRRALAHP